MLRMIYCISKDSFSSLRKLPVLKCCTSGSFLCCLLGPLLSCLKVCCSANTPALVSFCRNYLVEYSLWNEGQFRHFPQLGKAISFRFARMPLLRCFCNFYGGPCKISFIFMKDYNCSPLLMMINSLQKGVILLQIHERKRSIRYK